MENILIAGATGTTGQKIIHILKESDHYNPIPLVRKEEQRFQFEEQGIKTVLGDLEGDLSHVTKHADKVIFAAGSGGKKVKEVDQEGAKKLIDASKNSGIKKFVMLSSVGADAPESSEELQDYLQAKKNADEHLKKSNLTYVIVRAGQLTDDEGIEKIELASSVSKDGSISRADVGQVLVQALQDEVHKNATFEVINGNTTISEAMQSNKI